jgi:hypothetical protein
VTLEKAAAAIPIFRVSFDISCFPYNHKLQAACP